MSQELTNEKIDAMDTKTVKAECKRKHVQVADNAPPTEYKRKLKKKNVMDKMVAEHDARNDSTPTMQEVLNPSMARPLEQVLKMLQDITF